MMQELRRRLLGAGRHNYCLFTLLKEMSCITSYTVRCRKLAARRHIATKHGQAVIGLSLLEGLTVYICIFSNHAHLDQSICCIVHVRGGLHAWQYQHLQSAQRAIETFVQCCTMTSLGISSCSQFSMGYADKSIFTSIFTASTCCSQYLR